MVVLPKNVVFDLEKDTATIPIEHYKALYLAEKRYNWILKEVQENSISYRDVNPHSNQTYIKLGWPSHLTLNESIDKALKEKGERTRD